MDAMFYSATAFNGDLSNWNTAAVTRMHAMFYSATAFDGDLSNWNIAAVIDMTYMFYEASAFNKEFCWTVSNSALSYYRMCGGTIVGSFGDNC
jgi:surface protein